MHPENIQPRVVIVEDSDKIAKAFSRRLNIVKKANGYCLIPEYRLVSTFEGFKQSMEQAPLANIPYYSVIVDINLGKDHTDEGLEVLKYIRQNYPGLIYPIVYTAYPNQRQTCTDLGVRPDSFFVKHDGKLLDDIETIKQKIEGNFSESYHTGKLPNNINLLVSNSMIKRHYIYIGAQIGKEDFDHLNGPEQILLSHFFVNKISPGLNIFALKDRLWKFNVKEDMNPDFSDCFFIQETNPETGSVEGIHFRFKEKNVYLSLPDLETIQKSHETILDFIRKVKNSENRFIEFFLIKRLIDLYPPANTEERMNIMDFYKKIHYKENRVAFIFGIWEVISKPDGQAKEAHVAFFAGTSHMAFKDIFYCEIDETIKTDNKDIASVRLQSAEDNNIVFYRNFELALLESFGLKHAGDRFKMILFSEKEPLRESFTLEPLPPNILFD